MKVALDLAEISLVGKSRKCVLFRNPGKRHGARNELFNTIQGQIARRCRCRALAHEYPQPHAARTGFLQRLDLTHANRNRKLIALAHHSFSIGGPGFDGASDDLGG